MRFLANAANHPRRLASAPCNARLVQLRPATAAYLERSGPLLFRLIRRLLAPHRRAMEARQKTEEAMITFLGLTALIKAITALLVALTKLVRALRRPP
jgi:hypothetical protein